MDRLRRTALRNIVLRGILAAGAVHAAPQLLGMHMVAGGVTVRIVETEAYGDIGGYTLATEVAEWLVRAGYRSGSTRDLRAVNDHRVFSETCYCLVCLDGIVERRAS